MLSLPRNRAYLNFEEGAVDAQVFFDADTWRLLRALRTHWDPNGLFLANHEIKDSKPRSVPGG